MATDRRAFLWVASVGAVASILGREREAEADRLRILGGETDALARGVAPGQPSPDWSRFLAATKIGEGRRHRALQVFWLFGPPAAPLPVATLDEARAAGSLLVTEREQATVPELIVENRGKAHALLLAGEILLGGKQNRVLTEDHLLPPGSGPRPIGVYCVEEGRWAASGKAFESRGSFAAPKLRAQVMAKAPQSRIWASINGYASRLGAVSPTRSFQEVYEAPEVKVHLREVERELDVRPPAGVLGAAVFVGADLAGVDLFFDPGLFLREWPKLLRAQALDAYRRRAEEGTEESALRARLATLLATAADVAGRAHENAGVGQVVEFRLAEARGAALVFDGRVIHAAVLS